MTKEQAEKLQDYLDGFLGLNNTDTPPVGAVLVEENIHDKVLDLMVSKKMHVFNNSSDNMLENNLEKLSNSIENGQAVVIDSGVELSPVLNNIFLDFIHGKLSLNIPGKGGKVINPVPEKTKALFILTKDLFDNSDRFGKVVSSVCRL
ncbi:MAG: hypothetical protein Q8R55_04585 [Candidatus Taylorbacteria bacterium]|nr:hypothetical protein [Candidatus Taylorbacteria bacterium]